MMVMLENGVIPIVNENDTISVTELMFTDNDELSGMIASMMDMQALIILSNIDGIYNGSPSTLGTQVIAGGGAGKGSFGLYTDGEIGLWPGRYADKDYHCPQSGR